MKKISGSILILAWFLLCSAGIPLFSEFDVAPSTVHAAAEVTRVQSKSGIGSTNQSATFDATPTEGNLLVVVSINRSGASLATISGSGWTKAFERAANNGDSNNRRSMAVWWKIAEDSEPSTITTSWSPASNNRILIQEFAITGGGTFEFADEASNDSDTSNVTNLSTGSTDVLIEENYLLVGILGWRNPGDSSSGGEATWASSNLGENIHVGDGVEHLLTLQSAFGVDTTAGAKSSTATWGGGRIAISGILAFKVTQADLPEATYHTPFNNARLSDTTPNLEFSSEDQNGTASIVYQVEIDDSPDFLSLVVDCTSDNASPCSTGGGSFTNLDNGSDTSPFDEGNRIRFTLSTALSDDTTYFWRVRAKDDSSEGGSGSFGPFGAIQSFTIDPDVSSTDWYQTVDTQFNTGTLVGTETDGAGNVITSTVITERVQLATAVGTSAVATLPSSPTEGNLLVVTAAHRSDAVTPSISGTGWTLQINTCYGVNGGSCGTPDTSKRQGLAVWWKIAGSSEPSSVTVSWSPSADTAISLQEFSVVGGGEFSFDQAVSNTSTGNYVNSLGTGTTGTSNQDISLLISSLATRDVAETTTWTNGISDVLNYVANTIGIQSGYGMNYAQGTKTSTASWSTIRQAIAGLLVFDTTQTGASTITSAPISFNSISDMYSWGEVNFSADETDGDVKLRVYYTTSSSCDTIIPDSDLFGNETGFDASDLPINISGLDTETYAEICLQAILIDSGEPPELQDWSVSWLAESTIISVTVSDGVVNYGTVPSNTSKSTIALNDTQNALNDGSGTQTLNIRGENTACPWTLDATTDEDQYVHSFCNETAGDCSAPPTNYTPLTTTNQTLATGVASLASIDFQLNITMPTSSSCFDEQTATVTIQAVEE